MITTNQMRLRLISKILTSNVDKKVDQNETSVPLCNYVDVYKNNSIFAHMGFSTGSVSASELKKFKLLSNDVVITKDSETAEDIAIPAIVRSTLPDLVCGYHLSIIRGKKNWVDGRYLYWSILSKSVKEQFSISANGVTRFGLTIGSIGNIRIPLPDLPTQSAIADFLDRETARIDQLIEKKEKMVEVLGVRIEAIIDMGLNGAHWLRFENVSQEMNRPITIGTNSLFEPLGLYNRGRGFFRKQESEDSDLGDSDFSYVKKGDLVFSGQFAWEGAVGFVFDEFDSCVVSHRYPIFTGNSGVSSEYLYAYFRSHHGRFLMDNCSRGAAGRNRPLNVNVLKKQKIAIASTEIQLSAAKAIYQEYGMKKVITKSVSMLTEYRSSLITAAVTGQIDINDWQKSGAGDRRLDALQERLPA